MLSKREQKKMFLVSLNYKSLWVELAFSLFFYCQNNHI